MSLTDEDYIRRYLDDPGGDQVISFSDAEIPVGTIDGVNVTFSLSVSPNPGSSLKVFRNGLRLDPIIDYSLTGSVLVFVRAPLAGDLFFVDYRF